MSESPSSPRPNRRLTARRACHLTVAYRAADQTWHPATAMDLSVNGCRLRLGEDLTRGGEVTVRFTHPGREGSGSLAAEVQGQVIWSRREGLSLQAGIHFGAAPASLQQILETLG